MNGARLAQIVLLTVSVLLAGTSVEADIIVLTQQYTLEEVMNMAGGLRVGDKVFSEWSCTDSSDNGGKAPSPAAITVEGVKVLYPGRTDYEYGLRFTGNWSAFADQIADTVIRYKLTADDPWRITDNTLWMSASGAADAGQATITESVYKQYPPGSGSDEIASKYVFRNAISSNILAHVDYGAEYKELWVVKDVGVNGGNDPLGSPVGSAHISEFYQTFSQIPEPGTLVLLGAGLVLVGVVRRRRR